MFTMQESPFRFHEMNPETDNEIKEYIEAKFKNEKLLCVAATGNSFIYIDFNLFCAASMTIQTKVLEKIKSGN